LNSRDEVLNLIRAIRDLGGEVFYPGGEVFYLVCAVRDLGDRLSDPGGEVL